MGSIVNKMHAPIIAVDLDPAPKCPFHPDCVVPRYELDWLTREKVEELIAHRKAGRVCREHADEILPCIAVICEQQVARYQSELEAYEAERDMYERASRWGIETGGTAAHKLRTAYLRTAEPMGLIQQWAEAGLEGARIQSERERELWQQHEG